MLCTKIRLSERRFRLVSTLHHPQQTSTIVTSTITRDDGKRDNEPSSFNRPCKIQKIGTTAANNTENARSKSAKTPRINYLQKRSTTDSMSSGSDERAPLIIMTLFIPPETKTLAPSSIKRDPRRQPIFCQNFKTPSPRTIHAKDDDVPEIIIRGLDIGESNSMEMKEAEKTVEPVINTNESCCGCMQYTDCANLLMPPVNKTELCLNFDDYEMDQYGHLPGDSRTPTPSLICSDGAKSPITSSIWMRRACSPATGQVIRITMNDKSAKRKK